MALEVGRMFLLLSLEQVYMKLWIMSFAKPPRRLCATLNLASLDSAVLDVYTVWIELQGFSQAYCKF